MIRATIQLVVIVVLAGLLSMLIFVPAWAWLVIAGALTWLALWRWGGR